MLFYLNTSQWKLAEQFQTIMPGYTSRRKAPKIASHLPFLPACPFPLFSPGMTTRSSSTMASPPPVSSGTQGCQNSASDSFVYDIHNAVELFVATLNNIA